MNFYVPSCRHFAIWFTKQSRLYRLDTKALKQNSIKYSCVSAYTWSRRIRNELLSAYSALSQLYCSHNTYLKGIIIRPLQKFRNVKTPSLWSGLSSQGVISWRGLKQAKNKTHDYLGKITRPLPCAAQNRISIQLWKRVNVIHRQQAVKVTVFPFSTNRTDSQLQLSKDDPCKLKMSEKSQARTQFHRALKARLYFQEEAFITLKIRTLASRLQLFQSSFLED